MFRRPLLECLLALGLALAPAVLIADTPADAARATLEVPLRGDTLHVELIAPNIVHLSYRTQGQAAAPTLLIDPAWQPKAPADVRRDASGNALSTATLRVQWEDKSHALAISGADGRTLLRVDDPAALAHGELSVRHGAGQPLYGVGGYDAFQTDVSAGSNSGTCIRWLRQPNPQAAMGLSCAGSMPRSASTSISLMAAVTKAPNPRSWALR